MHSEHTTWGGFAHGTKLLICNVNSSIHICVSKPKCGKMNSARADLLKYAGESLTLIGQGSVGVIAVSSLGIAVFIGVLVYLKWKHPTPVFQQFDVENNSDKKAKVHRLSLFLAKNPTNPSEMQSV